MTKEEIADSLKAELERTESQVEEAIQDCFDMDRATQMQGKAEGLRFAIAIIEEWHP